MDLIPPCLTIAFTDAQVLPTDDVNELSNKSFVILFYILEC